MYRSARTSPRSTASGWSTPAHLGNVAGEPALIGHLEIADLDRWPQVLEAVQDMLLAKHGIDHVTLQPELHEARAPSL